MVHGLERFREYFKDFTSQYVFIGGTACDILMDELGAPFRATKDLDVVLVVEALDKSFGKYFWKFIEAGDYEHREKSERKNQFYRFRNPKDSSFPKMIELFSRLPDNLELKFDTGLTPIHIDDSIVSLSAILLNDVYYSLLINGKRILDGYSILGIETVILFKIKAYLDLKERKEFGENIDSNNIKKHKNDVFRLLANVSSSSKLKVVDEIQEDITRFIEQIKVDNPHLEGLGIRGITLDEMLAILKTIFS